MTRAQAMDVVNDSTTMQSRIDAVLAAPIMEWDHSPEIKWQPGDPLYQHPHLRTDIHTLVDSDGDEIWFQGGNFVRRMYDVIDDYATERMAGTMGCQTCLVSGDLNELECWNCGKRYDKPRLPMVSQNLANARASVPAMNTWLRAMADTSHRAAAHVHNLRDSSNGLTVSFTIDDTQFRQRMDAMYASLFNGNGLQAFSIIAPRRSGRSMLNRVFIDEWLYSPLNTGRTRIDVHPDQIRRVPPQLKIFNFDLGLRKPVVTNFNYDWFARRYQGVSIEIPNDIPTKKLPPPSINVAPGRLFPDWRLALLSEQPSYPTSTLATASKRRRHI